MSDFVPPKDWLRAATKYELLTYTRQENKRQRLLFGLYKDLRRAVRKGDTDRVAEHMGLDLAEYKVDELT